MGRLLCELLEPRLQLTAVVSVSPPANSHTASVATDVAATFDQTIDAATVTAETFTAHAALRGQLTAATASVGAVATLDPAANFAPGELVQVTATSGIQSAGGQTVESHVWQFRAATAGGTGTFLDSGQALGAGTWSVALGDLDTDGDLDAFVSGNGLPDEVWLNDGTGVLLDSGQRLGTSFFSKAALGDLDGDGDLDAFVSNFGDSSDRIWINNGGQFTDSGQTWNISGPRVALGDLDGDGDLDVFAPGAGNRVLLNEAGRLTDSAQQLGNSVVIEAQLGDLDGDGDLDAFEVNPSGPNRVWINDGSGQFVDSGQLLGDHWSSAASLGDLDGDGDLDAFVANLGNILYPNSAHANRIWLNDGGQFTDSGQTLGDHASRSVSLGDLDGDGDLDAFVTNSNYHGHRIWLNDGGTFTSAGQAFGIDGVDPSHLSLGDLDGDGDLDAVVKESATARIWLNQNPPNQVSLSVDRPSVEEAAGVATITATLSTAAAVPVTVELGLNGTASAAEDYAIAATQIVIPAGELSGTFTVTALQDLLDEPDETIVVSISDIANGEIAGGSQQVTVTILDDDESPTVDLTVDAAELTESGGAATATVVLSAPSGQDVSLAFTVAGTATGGTDYALTATQIVIPAGATIGSVTLVTIDDPIDEPDETIELTISATNATVGVGAQTITIVDDDDPPTVTLLVDDEAIEEDGGVATFTAALSAPAIAPVTVDLAVSGSATSSTDYTLSGTQIVIPAGATSGSVTVTSILDLLATEDAETVILEIAAVSPNATEDGEQSATTIIINDVNGPEVTLSIDPDTLAENGGVTMVTATLAEAFTLPVTVDFGFAGTGTSDTDYSVSATQVTIPVGQTAGTITLTGIDDSLFEGDEAVLIEIATVINGDETVPQQVAATLVDDDDPPLVTLSVSVDTIAEAAGSVAVTATLSEVSGQDAIVNLALSGTAVDSVDYEVSATQLLIPAGETSASMTVTAVQDDADDEQETIVIDIDSTVAATEDGVQQQTVIIVDDDLPEVTLSVDPPRIVEEAGVATLTAQLTSAATEPVTIDLAYSGTAEADTDYVASSTQIVIPVGESSGTVTVTAVADAASEPNETVLAEIVAVTNAREVTPEQAEITIEDDDGPPLVTLDIDADTIVEAGGVATVTATLARTIDEPVTIMLAFSGTAVGSDYTLSGTEIQIPTGMLEGSITITAVDDNLPEGDQTVVVDIESATGAVEEGTQQVTTTIVDDEPLPTVSLLLVSPDTIFENGGSAQVAAFLTGTTEAEVVIDLAFSGTATFGGDFDGPSQITINPGSLNSFTNFFMSIDDTLDEEDETVIITAASVTGASGGGEVSFTITDNDVVPEVSVEIFDSTILESLGQTIIRAVLSTPALEPVTVDLSYAAGSAVLDEDFTAPTQLVIQAGGFSASGSIVPTPDSLDEDNEQVVVEVSSVTNATSSGGQATTTIIDDDPEPTVSLTASAADVAEGSTLSLMATLTAVSGRDVTLDLDFSGNATRDTDYTVPAQIVVPAGLASASIELAASPDLVADPDETATVRVTGIANGTSAGEQEEVTLTILDVAPPVVPDVTLSAVPSEIPEESGVSTITATLSESTTVPVTIGLAISATGTATTTDDYLVSGLEIVVPPGETAGSVAVTSVVDELDEPDETLTLEIVSVSGGNESGEQSATVTILDDDLPPTFQVLGVTPTGSGFVAEFSSELDPSELNLYDAVTAGTGEPDVVLRGDAVGVVSGSLIVDPSLRRVSFVKTGDPLAADTYKVTLISGTEAFQDAEGNLLDGDQDGTAGGNYTTTFAVTETAPVSVSLPDFVRGPGQPVNLPADATTGIPVTISEGAGVRSATFHIGYDPALLEITAANVGAAMPAGATVELDTLTAGIAIVTFMSPTDLPAGNGVVVNLSANVPTENGSANYGRQQVIDLRSVTLTDASANPIPAVADDAVHVVSYFADTSGNGRINAADAAQLARVAALLDSGFASMLLTDPMIVGDISGNGRLNAADASLLAQYAALIDVGQIPDVPSGVLAAGAVSPVVSFAKVNTGVEPQPATPPDSPAADRKPAISASPDLIPITVDRAIIELDRSTPRLELEASLEDAVEELALATQLSG